MNLDPLMVYFTAYFFFSKFEEILPKRVLFPPLKAERKRLKPKKSLVRRLRPSLNSKPDVFGVPGDGRTSEFYQIRYTGRQKNAKNPPKVL
jgi:hypothetical protein